LKQPAVDWIEGEPVLEVEGWIYQSELNWLLGILYTHA
jgi:hypothetical protein